MIITKDPRLLDYQCLISKLNINSDNRFTMNQLLSILDLSDFTEYHRNHLYMDVVLSILGELGYHSMTYNRTV